MNRKSVSYYRSLAYSAMQLGDYALAKIHQQTAYRLRIKKVQKQRKEPSYAR